MAIKIPPFKSYQNGTLQSSGGFTIMEMVISISILAFGIVLVYGAFSLVTLLTYGASARFTAVYLAQEGLEIVRNLRDNNFINGEEWSLGLNTPPCSTGCRADYTTKEYTEFLPDTSQFLGLDSEGFYGYEAGGSPTIFKREITITPLEGFVGFEDGLNVNVRVDWIYNNKEFNYQASQHLYNWY